MRESLSFFLERASEERWLVGFLLFHVVGVHWLAGAKAWWMKWPGALCLMAAAPCWIKAVHLSPSMLGFNAANAVAGSSLVLLAGLWLFLAGRGPAEWVGGFAAVNFGAVGILFFSGQRWPAAACASLVIPLGFARTYFVTWEAQSDAFASKGVERCISTLATSSLAVILAISISPPSRSSIGDSETIDRLRDFVTQPAVLFLLIVGGLFFAAVSIRLWPQVETQ